MGLIRACLIALAAILVSLPAGAYHLPLWEVGVGIAAFRLPAYRGASGTVDYVVPFPYVAYRGERLRVDEEGFRGKLLERRRVRLDFSVAGNLPVQSDDEGPRAAMPGLDPIGEIGPSLEVSLWRDGERHVNGETELWLRLPVRAALSAGDPLLAHRGWVFSPSLDLVYRKGRARSLQRWNLSLGPLYATQSYHDYFYEVDPKYVTATRHEFHPDSGYSGARATLSLSVNMDKWFLFGFVRNDVLRGAVFEGSPLVESGHYFALGVAVSRVFGASEVMAPH